MADREQHEERSPSGRRVRLRFADTESFVLACSKVLTTGGIVLDGEDDEPGPGRIQFELVLRDGTVILRGEGLVLEALNGAAGAAAIQFERLDATSAALIAKLAGEGHIQRDALPPRPSERARQKVPQAGARASLVELDRRLNELLEESAVHARSAAPVARRSASEIDRELEQLSLAVLAARASRLPPTPDRAPGLAFETPSQSVGSAPAHDDLEGLPPVFSVFGEDGELRSALTPQPPPRPPTSLLPPWKAAARAMLEAAQPATPLMREPTPVPESSEEALIADPAIPPPPALPSLLEAPPPAADGDSPPLRDLNTMLDPGLASVAEAPAAALGADEPQRPRPLGAASEGEGARAKPERTRRGKQLRR